MMTCQKFFICLMLAPFAVSAELILESKPFAVTHSIQAVALPEEPESLRLEPKSWQSFRIVSIAKHGAEVKKGDALVVFDPVEIDKKIADTRRAVESAKLGLDDAKQELALLEETLPEELEKVKRAAEIASEELEYFSKTRRAASEEGAKYSLKYKEEQLLSAREELKQLLKMYEADDITEDTEEIILLNQRAKVEYAEFSLRMEKLDYDRTLAVVLPREAVSLTEQRDATALAYEQASKNLPRTLEMKKLELAEKEIAFGRLEESLADLENDRKLFEVKASENGIFYHGAIVDGKWVGGDYLKGLEENGTAPTGKVFACFIPSVGKLALHASVDQQVAVSLAKGDGGEAVVVGREEMAIAVKVSSVAKSPAPDGGYAVVFAADWPKDFPGMTGQEIVVRIVSYSKKEALLVPTKALDFGTEGWSVEVKLTNGKTERRVVIPGRSSGDVTEVISGLEAGQVIMVP